MFEVANVSKAATLSAGEAVTFLKRSGLDIGKLKSVWDIAAKSSNDYLTRNEFYVALRLIAYNQNGMRADEEAIAFDLEVNLPNFQDAPLAIQ